ncbi:Hypothetical protein R9X50_00086000 [Acrodontium crateriforme]|uniref:Uncharacterized protein n=1 Tax=Acrodontium crateriforme TaxID=150365 RepID=A0AAQ3LYB4_9PEZI|nr:Hypothetical protein R9X50_00086000 [Acrodontium crateriforme]
MAPSRALLVYICKRCLRQQPFRRSLSTSPRLYELDESRLPRVANPSLWTSLIPKPFRRTTDPVELAERERIKAAKLKGWNPYTFLIILGVVVGSNAINLIALRNEMLNFTRKTEAKLALLREVIQRVKNGEDIDVKRILGTGDPEQEQEWEDVMKELETTDMLWESKKKKDAQRLQNTQKLAETKVSRKREILSPREREGGSEPLVVDKSVEEAKQQRPKFIM